jgi:hypothetical protein
LIIRDCEDEDDEKPLPVVKEDTERTSIGIRDLSKARMTNENRHWTWPKWRERKNATSYPRRISTPLIEASSINWCVIGEQDIRAKGQRLSQLYSFAARKGSLVRLIILVKVRSGSPGMGRWIHTSLTWLKEAPKL